MKIWKISGQALDCEIGGAHKILPISRSGVLGMRRGDLHFGQVVVGPRSLEQLSILVETGGGTPELASGKCLGGFVAIARYRRFLPLGPQHIDGKDEDPLHVIAKSRKVESMPKNILSALC